MLKNSLRRVVAPVLMGLLVAALGFSYSTATRTDGARVPVIPPGATLPPATVVTGSDSDTTLSIWRPAPPNYVPPDPCNDLGGVVVNREFTRTINVTEGYPPYEFLILINPDNSDIGATTDEEGQTVRLVGSTKPGVRLRAVTPEVQPPPAALDASFLPQYVVMGLQIDDNNPDVNLQRTVIDFCFTVFPVIQGRSNFNIVDMTNVIVGSGVSPGVIDPGFTGNPVPTNLVGIDFTPLTVSDGVSYNDLPTALQSQDYEYQLHTNGGDRFGGDVGDEQGGSSFVGIDSDEPSNYPGAISPDTTSIYGGSASGTYTFVSEHRGGDPAILDLVVSFDGDPDELGLRGDTVQVFLDVMGVGGVIAAGRTLSIGSLGARININPSEIVIDPDTGQPVELIAHDGDQWSISVTGLEDQILEYSLHPDSTPMPDGLRLEEDGLITGIPRRAGDFTFVVKVKQIDPEDENLELNEADRQIFIRVRAAPVSSQMVLAGGSFRLKFGAVKRDSMGLHMFLAKGSLRNGSQLKGASFDMIIGDETDTRVVLSSQVQLGPPGSEGGGGEEQPTEEGEEALSPLTFSSNGMLKWPPKNTPGNPVGNFIQDARVLIKPLNPNSGSMKLKISRLNLAEAIGAPTAGVAGLVEVPLSISIKGGDGNLNLTFDEIVTFNYRTSRSYGIGTVPPASNAATLNIGQFLISHAAGSIVFDAASGGNDTLNMTLKGYLRKPDRLAFTRGGAIPDSANVHIFLGSQAGYEGTYDDFVQKGSKLVLANGIATIPIKSFIIDNRKGTFTMQLRAPATNAGTIAGEATGLVISAVEPFLMTVRIRIFSNGADGIPLTVDDISYLDAQYSLTLFRSGNRLSVR